MTVTVKKMITAVDQIIVDEQRCFRRLLRRNVNTDERRLIVGNDTITCSIVGGDGSRDEMRSN